MNHFLSRKVVFSYHFCPGPGVIRAAALRRKENIKVNMKSTGAILKKLGVDERGVVQVQHTRNVLHRIQRYMPMNTGQTIRIMVAQTRVGKMNVYALSDGLPVWVNLMLAVMDEIDTAFAREQKQTNPRIAKYTAKYHK